MLCLPKAGRRQEKGELTIHNHLWNRHSPPWTQFSRVWGPQIRNFIWLVIASACWLSCVRVWAFGEQDTKLQNLCAGIHTQGWIKCTHASQEGPWLDSTVAWKVKSKCHAEPSPPPFQSELSLVGTLKLSLLYFSSSTEQNAYALRLKYHSEYKSVKNQSWLKYQIGEKWSFFFPSEV